MSEIEILKIVNVVAIGVIVWLAKYGFDQLMKKLDELIKATRENNADIKLLKDKVETHDKRLNAHSDSIRTLERKVM